MFNNRCNHLIIIWSRLRVFRIYMHETLGQSHYQQPGVILSPDSFVHRRQAVSVSKIQMSAALNQHLDTFCWKAWLHGHREWSLWRRTGVGGYKEKWTSMNFTLSLPQRMKPCTSSEMSFPQREHTDRVVANSPPLSGSWKFGSRPLSRTFAIFSIVPVWM